METLQTQEQQAAVERSEGDVDLSTFLEALADRHSRTILLCATERAKTIEQICQEGGIPLSTGYRKAKSLVRRGLLVVESMTLNEGGKKRSRYRSTFATLTFSLTKDRVSIDAVVNPAVKARAARHVGLPNA